MMDVLEKFRNNKQFVCVHADIENLNKFIYGKICWVDEEFFVVSMVSPDGEYDGFLIKKINDIIFIEHSLKYDNKMSILLRDKEYKERNLQIVTNNILEWGLLFAKKNNFIVSVEFDHSGVNNVVGFVDSIKANICTMKQVDEYGIEDGESYFALSDISQICIDSSDEKRLATLFKGY